MATPIENLEARRLLALAAGDFNGDGREDLAIGVHREDIDDAQGTPNALEDAGAVQIIYGTVTGLRSTGAQLWNLDSPGIKGKPGAEDKFGQSVAAGDFDNDGFDDVAIGIVERTVSGQQGAGSVLVLYGSEDGLTADRARFFSQALENIAGVPEAGDRFGMAVGSGDFDDDGFDDLAISASGEASGDIPLAGAVHILHGSNKGLSAKESQVFGANTNGVRGDPHELDFFGERLASGDFNDDGFADLAIANAREQVGDQDVAGALHVLFGRKSGLSAKGDQLITQNTDGLNETAEEADDFGKALAVEDFNGDGVDDLAISAFGETDGTGPTAYKGIVHLLLGDPQDKLQPSPTSNITRNEIPDLDIDTGSIGVGLSAGDFDNDGFGDLAFSAHHAKVDVYENAGRATVVYGGPTGFDLDGNPRAEVWDQSIALLGETPEANEGFSHGLGAGDFDGDGRDDLTIGASAENFDAIENVGIVHVVYGFIGGLTPYASQIWWQDSPGIPGVAEADDELGGQFFF